MTPHLRFEVELKGATHLETTSLEQVLAIDNTQKARIEELIITCTDSAKSEKPAETIASIDFDGTARATILATVRASSAPWVNETLSAIEDQAERTLQKSLFHRLRYNEIGSALFALVILAGLLSGAFFAASTLQPTKLTNRMWLSPQDLAQLEEKTSHGNLTADQATEVLSRQIRNVIQMEKQRTSILVRLTNWKTIVAVAPFLLIAVALIYLYLKCYPRAVFLWGDTEAWYSDILRKRNFIWASIIIAFAVSIFSNLFMLAFHT